MLRHACATAPRPKCHPGTVRAHIIATRPTGKLDPWGSPGLESLLSGIGWRHYSARTGLAWIDGEWRTLA